ncbi:MAG: hypothetical protein DRJ21_02085, partial [Candidatus Methanomethylicota archaeon]
MFRCRKFILTVLLLFTLALAITSTINVTAKPEKKGPRAEKLIFVEYGTNWEAALLDVAEGKAATFVWGASKEAYEKYKDDPRVKFFLAPSGIHSFILNPTYNESDPTKFNPFAIKKIRYAMNFLFDREWYVSQVLGGLGKPMYTALSEFDPDFLVVLPSILKHNIKFDEDYALKLIEEGMKEANETAPWTGKIKKIEGKWYYNGEPVKIIGAIRSDDPRRKTMGEYFANQLEKAGFTVERKYGTFRELIPVIYLSDPRKLEWHFYTEGWGGGFSRYSDWDPIFFYTTAYWQWQFGTPSGFNGSLVKVKYLGKLMTLDDVAKILGDGKYKNVDERNEAMRVICDVGISSSVRIFVAKLAEAYFVNSKVSKPVVHFGYGTGNRWFFLTASMEGTDTLTIAMVHVTETEPWNWANDDWYTHIIWQATYEAGISRHPHNGKVLPVCASYKVETKGPEGTYTVPDTALLWDPYQNKWVSPSELSDDFLTNFYDSDLNVAKSMAKKAKSKVTFTYKFPTFHDGSKESLADIFYSLYFNWQWAVRVNDTDPTYDESQSPSLLSFMSMIRGIEVINDNTLVVYIDYWHFDPDEIADMASIFTGEPWHLLWAQEQLVISGAYSWTAEEIAPRIDLRNADHANSIKTFLSEAAETGKAPRCLKLLETKGVVSLDDAVSRYNNAISFIDKYGHAIIGNGPYYVTKVDFVAMRMELEAWRDPGYPWEVGHWDELAELKKADIVKVDVPEAAMLGISFESTIDITGTTSDELEIVSALVVDSEGNIIYSTSEYEVVDEDTIKIPMKIEKTGLFSLRVAVASTDVIIPSVKEVPLKVVEVEPYVKSLEEELSSAKDEIVSLQADIAKLQSEMEKIKVERYEAGKSEGYSSGMTTGAVIGLIVGLVIG